MGSVRRVHTSSRTVILTYDDGPHPVDTRALIAVLGDAGHSATFFMLMSQVARYPEIVREAVDAGNEVALHGCDHRRLTRLPTSEIRGQISVAKDQLEQLTQRPVRWFRPPYGAQTLRTWAAVRSCGLMPVMWSASARDSLPGSVPSMVTRATANLAPGTILLFHDRQADSSDNAERAVSSGVDRPRLARALMATLAERGFVASSLERSLDEGGHVARSAWFGGR